MADLFKEVVPSILQTKKYALLNSKDEREYNSFLVNKALSYYPDTVMIANEMNKYPTLDNKLKYDFFLNIVKSRKRPFARWHNSQTKPDLELVKEYYGYSTQKAQQALSILGEDQIKTIRKELEKGD